MGGWVSVWVETNADLRDCSPKLPKFIKKQNNSSGLGFCGIRWLLSNTGILQSLLIFFMDVHSIGTLFLL